MFEEYFVTYVLAKALRTAGFDEPCIGVWEYSIWDDEPKADLHINYLSPDTTEYIYNQEIQALLKSQPGLFQEKRSNPTMPPWRFAAPFYDQVLEWLLDMGLYVQYYRVPYKAVSNWSDVAVYGAFVNDLDSNHLWPAVSVHDVAAVRRYYFKERREAIEQAIMAALKLHDDKIERTCNNKIP